MLLFASYINECSQMRLFPNIFGRQKRDEEILKSDVPAAAAKETTADIAVRENVPPGVTAWRYSQILEAFEGLTHPKVVGSNFMELFRSIPEVAWPIDYIARRISEAHYDLKRIKDDSLVWCNRQNVDSFPKSPNPVTTWKELLYQHFVYKLVTGNAFFRASMPDTFTEDAIKCQFCDFYWELPSDKTKVVPNNQGFGVPLFGLASRDDMIRGYKLNVEPYQQFLIPAHQIWHDRDGMPEYLSSESFLKARSRLESLRKPISNLIAVYEARNVIYVKRGAVGFIVSRKEDSTGTVALDPDEKKELLENFNKRYGLGEGQSPYVVTDVPVDFVQTSMSITDLQPFEETLADAIVIAGRYGIPAVLVPRKDQATFSNQDAAEKSVYDSVIMPMAKRFCDDLTSFLGLDKKGYYLSADFGDVACLQTGRKDAEEVRTKEYDRAYRQFESGLITLDDIRGIMHLDALADRIPLFGKLKYEMTPEELETVNNISKSNTNTSKGESNEGNNDEPAVEDRGE